MKEAHRKRSRTPLVCSIKNGSQLGKRVLGKVAFTGQINIFH